MKSFTKKSSLPILLWVLMSLLPRGTKAQMYVNNLGVYLKKVSLVNGALSTTPDIYVKGDITLTNGAILENSSELQATGNIIIDGTSNYSSTGDDGLVGANSGTPDATYNKYLQRISGTNANGLTGSYGFNNLIIQKPAWTNTTDSRIELGINVDVANSITWSGTGGIIRTDLSSHTNNGSAYPYFINLKNGSPSSLTGYNWTAVNQWSNTGGATDKYIEGRLKRTVTTAATYDFPIGVEPTSLDGMEAFSVTFTSAPSNALLGYIQPATTVSYLADLITNGGILFYDIGSLPAASPANQFPACVGSPDGHDDVAAIDQAVNYEWVGTLDNPVAVAYTLQVHPGSVMDNVAWVSMGGSCNSVYKRVKYLGLNGRIGGNQSVGPTTNYWVPGVTGLYQSPTGNQLVGQTSFGRFRLFGATNPANTSLPVELVTFNGFNEGARNVLNWTTASELNADRFEVQKSSTGNGGDWQYIGFQKAVGNNQGQKDYTFYDNEPLVGNNYYRLKMIDYDGTFTYSNNINIPISEAMVNSFVKIFPNPTSGKVTVQLQSTKDISTELRITNLLGQTISVSSTQLTKGLNQLIIDLNGQPAGTYLISFTDASGVKHIEKLIKN